jgi:hypothetical protein
MLATSSMAQLNEQWSMTTFFTGLASVPSILSASRLSGSAQRIVAEAHADVLNEDVRRWMRIAAPRIMMPGDGAVCRAMVRW